MKHIAFGILLATSGFGTASPQIEKKVVDGVTYHVLRAAPDAVRIVWEDKEGKPLRTFQAAARFLRNNGEKPLAFTNGGIFEPGGIPSGLLVRNGKAGNWAATTHCSSTAT
jgi:uncharacterized protein YigE (DUF2233 family)